MVLLHAALCNERIPEKYDDTLAVIIGVQPNLVPLEDSCKAFQDPDMQECYHLRFWDGNTAYVPSCYFGMVR
jgi:hypothetical protein